MICLCLQPRSVSEAGRLLESSTGPACAVELRLDGMETPAVEGILPVRGRTVIVTIRKREEGGAFRGTEEERLRVLAGAVRLGADYVDLELSAGEKAAGGLREEIARRGGQTKLILSFHDFSGTPAPETLRGIVLDARRMGADVVKTAVTARSLEDNLALIDLLRFGAARGIPMAAHCMGEAGRLSRAAAPLFGSLFSYAAPSRGKETAPGQFTAHEMTVLGRLLGYEP
ncbi:MAG TPA: type I 3-dehydroquinate dehydratase [Syntrophales bacterium]|nr:type I 3-dehydroquinate dehydratase [Syntrophales bacterium]HQN78360.1 type I 3-dehydroquinate dehydratase [Syntrophales bacterium]HQQ27678.1 type I 3-dehydroquinate dehydratase [Syntrophales bacterium]